MMTAMGPPNRPGWSRGVCTGVRPGGVTLNEPGTNGTADVWANVAKSLGESQPPFTHGRSWMASTLWPDDRYLTVRPAIWVPSCTCMSQRFLDVSCTVTVTVSPGETVMVSGFSSWGRISVQAVYDTVPLWLSDWMPAWTRVRSPLTMPPIPTQSEANWVPLIPASTVGTTKESTT